MEGLSGLYNIRREEYLERPGIVIRKENNKRKKKVFHQPRREMDIEK
jgi:hypothetical protein